MAFVLRSLLAFFLRLLLLQSLPVFAQITATPSKTPTWSNTSTISSASSSTTLCTECALQLFLTTLSYTNAPLSYGRTITVSGTVIPLITSYSDGSVRTHYTTVTVSENITISSIATPDAPTWVYSGVVLTYPTTYIAFPTVFAAASTPKADPAIPTSTKCAPRAVSSVAMPTTATQHLIFPLPPTYDPFSASQTSSITQYAFSYVANLPTVSAQISLPNGAFPTNCTTYITSRQSTAGNEPKITIPASTTRSTITNAPFAPTSTQGPPPPKPPPVPVTHTSVQFLLQTGAPQYFDGGPQPSDGIIAVPAITPGGDSGPSTPPSARPPQGEEDPAANLPSNPEAPPSRTVTANPGTVVIGGGDVPFSTVSGGGVAFGITIVRPGETATINNVPVVVPTISSSGPVFGSGQGSGSNSIIVANGQTIALPPSAPSAITVNNQPLTMAPNGALVGSGTTIQPGQVATFGSTVVSVGSSGVVNIDGTQTVQLSAPTNAPIVRINGQQLTLAPGGALIGASTTLAPGAVITSAGTRISIGRDGTVVIGGQTTVLSASGSQANTLDLGGYIFSGMGGPQTRESVTAAARATATASSSATATSKSGGEALRSDVNGSFLALIGIFLGIVFGL